MASGMSRIKATSTNTSGSSTNDGMEEGEATPVGRVEPAAQVVPPLDLVHGLVADDLVEDRRRGVPVDAAQNEEAAVEPCIEQAPQIGIDRGERRIARRHAQQVTAHRDDLRGRPGRQVEAAEKLDARAFQRPLQLGEAGVGEVIEMRLGCGEHTLVVGPHLRGEEREEPQPLGGVEACVAIEQLARDGDAGGFAATGDQRPRQFLDIVARIGSEQRLGQQRPALLGHRAQQFLKKRDVQKCGPSVMDEATIARLRPPGTAARRHTCRIRSAVMAGGGGFRAAQPVPCRATAW